MNSLFNNSLFRKYISNQIGYVIFDLNDPLNPNNISVVDNGVMSSILSQFYRCLSKYNKYIDRMEIVRMDECNIDLNSLPLDIDVMVHFPKFYYKGIYLPNNLYLYCFSLIPLLGYNEAYESLVGAYKGYVFDDKLYSRSGVERTTNLSYDSFSRYSRNRGKGYHLIDYQQHCIISWMFYYKYRTKDSQSILGRGLDKYNGVLNGSTNHLWMKDTNPSDECLVNFLGIEGVYGYIYEFIEGIHSHKDYGVIVYDKGDYHNLSFELVKSNTKRILVDKSIKSYGGWIDKVYDGNYMDMLPKSTNGDIDEGYCSYGYVYPYHTCIFMRSNGNDSSNGGVSCLCFDVSNNDSLLGGSRLAYTGELSVVDDIIKISPSMEAS